MAERMRRLRGSSSGPSENEREFREKATAEEQLAMIVSDSLDGYLGDFPKIAKRCMGVVIEEELPLPVEEPPDDVWELLVVLSAPVEYELRAFHVDDGLLLGAEWVTPEHLQRGRRAADEMSAAHRVRADQVQAQIEEYQRMIEEKGGSN
jgi:hypothetical protein